MGDIFLCFYGWSGWYIPHGGACDIIFYHHSDVTLMPWLLKITANLDRLLKNLLGLTPKKLSKLYFTVLCEGNPLVTYRSPHEGPIMRKLFPYHEAIHYYDVIMITIASQISGASIVNPTVCSDADQRKHQSSVSLTFVRGIHRWPVNSPHKGPVTRKCFHLMTSSWMINSPYEKYVSRFVEFCYSYIIVDSWAHRV